MDATGLGAGSAVDLAGEDEVAKPGESRRAAELRTARRLKWAESPEAQPRLEKLAAGGDKYAAAALYELAHFWLFRKRMPEKTIAISIDYEKRFPHGKDASEVLWLRIEAYVDKDERVSARAAAELYLARYPNGEKRERAGEVLGR